LTWDRGSELVDGEVSPDVHDAKMSAFIAFGDFNDEGVRGEYWLYVETLLVQCKDSSMSGEGNARDTFLN
jgi:hypothetical protein